MIERRCECQGCRAWRLAIRIALAAVAAMLLAGVLARASHAGTIVACVKVELPGKEHTLNPHDPPEKQRQEVARLCGPVEVKGGPDRFAPIVDRRRDPRAWS